MKGNQIAGETKAKNTAPNRENKHITPAPHLRNKLLRR
jgi:hypothetical protein